MSETDQLRFECDARTIEALASTLDVTILVFDRDDTVIGVSSGMSRMFDVPAKLMAPGTRLRDFLGAMYDAGAGAMGALNGRPRAITREDWIAERIAVHWRERSESVEKLADGRWVRLRKRRMPDGLLISMIEDVTEQKHKEAEFALTQQKAELSQLVLDDLPHPVIVKDAELRYVIVNKAFCRIPGMKPNQVIGLTAGNLVGPELAAQYETLERNVLETGIPYRAKSEIFQADGTVMPVVTRMHRSGVPGNYFVTILLEEDPDVPKAATVDLVRRPAHDAAVVSAVERRDRPGNSTGQPKAQRRVLVVDENPQRSDTRVAALKLNGADAVTVSSAEEARAFLDAANAMNLVIDDVELSAQLAGAIDGKTLPAPQGDRKHAHEQRHSEPPDTTVQAEPRTVKSVSGISSAPRLEPSQMPGTAEPDLAVVPAPPASPMGKRVRVLVAEDNDVNQIVFEQVLEAMDVDFRIVENGHEAVAAWHAAAPDIILMDISMPMMNGLQATQAIRDAEAAAGGTKVHVPIIAVTAHAMTGDRERCFAAGMDDYLSKPVSPDKLERMIEKWIDAPQWLQAAG
ncbi:response regulator [Hoeflea sp. YIM 152468]|uniref:response regulator n=1 Tax=Hoeflea sp. YIM 152468 TaxID=3031759 RepID=UPI0023DA6698|nr:response regulator [Hoeflea sp. YIM 152468]MDF1606765.1 response regulator [Hoeflea sp. YIM 152468]